MQHARSYSLLHAPEPPSIEAIEQLTPRIVEHMRSRVDGWLMVLNTWADDDRDRLTDIAAALKSGDDCEAGKLLRAALDAHFNGCADWLAECYLDRNFHSAEDRQLMKDFRP